VEAPKAKKAKVDEDATKYLKRGQALGLDGLALGAYIAALELAAEKKK
jgi:hypothetical protein